MRRALAVVVLVLSATTVAAQEREWRLTLRGASVGHEAEPCAVLSEAEGLETGRSFGAQIEGAYMVTDHLAVAFSLTTAPMDLDGVGELAGVTGGDFWFTPVTLTTRYEFPAGGGYTPYLGLGFHGSFLVAFSVHDPLEERGVRKLKADPGFGLTGEIGLSYDLGQDHFVNVQATYLDVSNDLKFEDGSGQQLAQRELAGSSFSFGLGYGWRF